MKLIVRPKKENIDKFIGKGINSFLLPLDDYSVGYIDTFTMEDIKAFKKENCSFKVFVLINKSILNKDIKDLEDTMKILTENKLDGIFFSDLSLLQLKKELSLDIDLVWNDIHMVTNTRTCNYYYDQGVSYAVASSEITLEEAIAIADNSTMKVILPLIYHPKVAFSKRKLITNYTDYYQKENKKELLIHEKISDQNYMLTENKHGTSFMLDKVVNGALYLDQINKSKIEYGLIHDELNIDTMIEVLNHIQEYFATYENSDFDLEKWKKKQMKLLGEYTSFFEQKTIYKVKRK